MKFGDPDGWFLAIQRVVEERIRQAQRDGLFDDLPGKGKPLKLEDDSRICPSLRSAYRILRNAGILPPEMQVRKEISHLRQLLAEVQEEDEARQLVREINEKVLAANILGGFPATAQMDQIYAEKVIERIRDRKYRMQLERPGGKDGKDRRRSV